MIEWQLAEAKNKFSEIVTLALTQTPQKVRRRHQTVMIISQEEYDKLKGKQSSFVNYLMEGPSFEELDLTRDTNEGRDFAL